SLLVEWQFRKYGTSLLAPRAVADIVTGTDTDAPEAQKKTAWQRLNSISETSLHDFIDITVFLILGALLASVVRILVKTTIGPDEMDNLMMNFPAVAILSMMLLA